MSVFWTTSSVIGIMLIIIVTVILLVCLVEEVYIYVANRWGGKAFALLTLVFVALLVFGLPYLIDNVACKQIDSLC